MEKSVNTVKDTITKIAKNVNSKKYKMQQSSLDSDLILSGPLELTEAANDLISVITTQTGIDQTAQSMIKKYFNI
jgi:hypothetical protein